MEDPQNGKNTPTCVQMNRILAGEQFTFLADQDKAFILAFGQSMSEPAMLLWAGSKNLPQVGPRASPCGDLLPVSDPA